MPGWTSPDTLDAIIQDMQRQIRQLQTYNPQPLINGQVLMSQVLNYHPASVIGLGNTTSWAAAWGTSFNLAASASVLLFATGSMVSNTGTPPNSSYQWAALRIDGSPGGTYSAIARSTVGGGFTPYTLLAVGQSLGVGTHFATIDYEFDATGSTTATHTDLYMHAFIIGG